jgi:hypothetical protein
MIKKILAIVAAALCAGAIVEFIPESAPADAVGALPVARSHETIISASNQPAVFAAVRIAESPKAFCSQRWPYYEPPAYTMADGRTAKCASCASSSLIVRLRATPRKRDLSTSEQIYACFIRALQKTHCSRQLGLYDRRRSRYGYGA